MHLTDEQLNEYLDRESPERNEIEVHLSSCADCAARLSALQALFDEIESLPDLALSRPIAPHLTLLSSLPSKLPRFFTLTLTLQAALAIVTIIVAAPFVMQFVSPYLLSIPAPSIGDVFLQIQTQWMLWLDTLSQFQMPTIPEIPALELSSLFSMFTVIGVSLLWLIGNGLLLRNQMK
jgi:hypothetical protein